MLWWTWHDLNVRPRPSQSRALIPLSYRSETCAICDCRLKMAEGEGVEPSRRNARPGFQDQLRAAAHRLPDAGSLTSLCETSASSASLRLCRLRRKPHETQRTERLRRDLNYKVNQCCLPIDLAGTPGFEPRISGLESDGLPLAYAPGSFGACGRTRTYEVRTDARFTVGCFCCSATHAKRISNFKSRQQDFKSRIHCAKK